MSDNIRDRFRDTYESKIFSLTHNKYEIQPKDHTYDASIKAILQIKLNMFIDKYFRCINGYIGHDYVLLQSTVYDYLYYILIKDEALTEKDEITRRVESVIAFCLFISCIYSIKEKYLDFVGCINKNGKLKFNNNILTAIGITKITEIFKKAYSIIGKYCEARNQTIHSTYDIEANENSEIVLSLSKFSLKDKDESLISTRPIIFQANITEVSSVLEALYILKKEYVDVVSDVNNIDIVKFTRKYSSNGTFHVNFP